MSGRAKSLWTPPANFRSRQSARATLDACGKRSGFQLVVRLERLRVGGHARDTPAEVSESWRRVAAHLPFANLETRRVVSAPAVIADRPEFRFGMNSGARRAATVQPEGACRSPHLCRRASARRWCFRGGASTCPTGRGASGVDDLRSSASSSTWHSCFACASDTVVITGQPVADRGICICTRANRGQRAHWCKGRQAAAHGFCGLRRSLRHAERESRSPSSSWCICTYSWMPVFPP